MGELLEEVRFVLSADTSNAEKHVNNIIKILEASIFQAQQLELQFKAVGGTEVKGLATSFGNVNKVVKQMVEAIKSGNTETLDFAEATNKVVTAYTELYGNIQDTKRGIKEIIEAEKNRAKEEKERQREAIKAEKEIRKEADQTAKQRANDAKEREKSRKQAFAEEIRMAKEREKIWQDIAKLDAEATKLKSQGLERTNQSIHTAENIAASNRAKELADLKAVILERNKEQGIIAKTNLEEEIATAKINALKKLGNTQDLAKVNTSTKNIALLKAEYEVLKAKNAQGEHSLALKKLELQITKEQLQADIASAKSNAPSQVSEDYNSMMSVHAAKRAVGYTLLFSAIFAVSEAFKEAIAYTFEYGKALLQMEASLDLTKNQAVELEGTLEGLGVQYGEQLADLNKVTLELGRAGVAYENLASATKIVNQLAILTGDTIESSAAAVVSYVQVFSKDNFGNVIATTDELGAKLAFLANASKMNTQDINTFSNYALAAAKSVGMTIDQVNALAVSLNNAGKNASTVGTNIRRFTTILGDSDTKVQEFFNKIGINQRNLQRDFAKGGEESNKAFKNFIDVLSSYSTASINESLNGMDILTRDTLQAIRNSSDEIKKAFSESMDVTRDEINKANKVTESMERQFISMGNSVKKSVKDNILPSLQSIVSVLHEAIVFTEENKLEVWANIGTTRRDRRNLNTDEARNAKILKDMDTALVETSKKLSEFLNTNSKVDFEAFKQGKDYMLEVLDTLDKTGNATLDQSLKIKFLRSTLESLNDVKLDTVSAETNDLIKQKEEEIKKLEEKTDKTKYDIQVTTQAQLEIKKLNEEINKLTQSMIVNQDKLLEKTNTFISADMAKNYVSSLNMISSTLASPETAAVGKEMLQVVTSSFEAQFKETIPSMHNILATTVGNAYETQLNSLVDKSGDVLINGINTLIAEVNSEISNLSFGTDNPDDTTKKKIEELKTFLNILMNSQKVTSTFSKLNSDATKKEQQEQAKLKKYTLDKLKLEESIKNLKAEINGEFKSEVDLAAESYAFAVQRYAQEIEFAKTISDEKDRELAKSKAMESLLKSEANLKKANLEADLEVYKTSVSLLDLEYKIKNVKNSINGVYVSDLTIAKQEEELARKKYEIAKMEASNILDANKRKVAEQKAELEFQKAREKTTKEQRKTSEQEIKDKAEYRKLSYDAKSLEDQIAGVKKSNVTLAREALELAKKEYDERIKEIQSDTRLNTQQKLNEEEKARIEKLKVTLGLTKAIEESNEAYANKLREINQEQQKYQYLLSGQKIPEGNETQNWYDDEKADILNNPKYDDSKRQQLLAELDILKQQKEAYVGITKAVGDYAQKLPDTNQALENITTGALSSMQSGLNSFFDISSDGFMDMGQLAKSVLSSILQQIIQNIVVAQIMRAIMGGFSSGSAEIGGVSSLGSLKLATGENGGYVVPTKGYASGGLLTGGSGTRDDLYLGNVGGTTMMAMGGEFITRKSSTNNNTRPMLEYINQTGQLPQSQPTQTQVSVNSPVSIKVDNQSGVPIEAEVMKQLTQKNSQGEEERIVQVILKRMNTDLQFRNTVRGGR